jgi:hypothetical protein
VVPVADHGFKLELFYADDWHDHTGSVLAAGETSVAITGGKSPNERVFPPFSAAFTLKGYGLLPSNPNSVLFGLRNIPVRITADADVRVLEAASWKPRKARPGHPARVEVVAAGRTRRANIGTDASEDAVARFARLNGAVAHWPLDDPTNSTKGRALIGAHLIVGVPGTLVIDDNTVPFPPTWSTGQVVPWLPNAVELRQAEHTDGSLTTLTRPTLITKVSGGGSATEWAIDYAFRGNPRSGPFSLYAGDLDLDPDFFVRIDTSIVFDPEDVQVRLWGQTGVLEDFGTFALPVLTQDDQAHHYRLHVDSSGGLLRWTIYVDGVSVATDTSASFAVPPLRGFRFFGPGGQAMIQPPPGVLISSMIAWVNSVPPVADTFAAYRGHAGESAGERTERLCDEEAIGFTGTGTMSDTILLGPQYPDGLLAILREAAEADHGYLHDARDSVGLHYRTGRSRYNQTPALELDFAAKQIAPPFEPVIDDLAARNDVTVKRRDGGSVRMVDQDGPLGVDAIGRIATEPTVNVLGDGMLGDQAGWLLHEGTDGSIRWPQVTIDLDHPSYTGNPALAADVTAVDVGDLVTIANLDPELHPDLAELIVEGYVDRIGIRRRVITFKCAPGAPFRVGIYADDDETPDPDAPMRRDTAGAELAAEFEAGTDTTMSVATTLGPLWGVTGDDNMDFPLDVRVAGARVRVTGISGSGSPQTFTVSATVVNGVEKTVPAGEPVSLWQPAIRAL